MSTMCHLLHLRSTRVAGASGDWLDAIENRYSHSRVAAEHRYVARTFDIETEEPAVKRSGNHTLLNARRAFVGIDHG